MTTGEVRRQFVVNLQTTTFDEITSLTLPAEAIRLKLDQGGKGERVIAGDNIHILLADAGHAEQSVTTVVAGHVMDFRPRIVPGRTRRHSPASAAHDKHRWLTEVIGPFPRSDYQSG